MLKAKLNKNLGSVKKEVPQHEMVLLGPKSPQFETLKTRVHKTKFSKNGI